MNVLSKCLRWPRSKHVEVKTTTETFNKGLQRSHGGVIWHHILRPCQARWQCVLLSISRCTMQSMQNNAKDCDHCEHSCAHNDHSPKRPHEFKEPPVALWWYILEFVPTPPQGTCERLIYIYIGFFISCLRKKQGPRHPCSTNCPCQPLEDYCKPRRGTAAQSIFINFPIGSRPSQTDWIMDDSSWCRIICECCACWFDLKLASSTSKYVRCLRLFLIYCSVS